MTVNKETVKIGACEVELLYGEKRLFIGIGKVLVDGTAIRSGERPMSPEIRNPNGILVTDFREAARKVSDSEIEISLSMSKVEGGPMEFMLHTARNRYNTANWTQEPEPLDGELKLILKPVERTFGATKYKGFSYQYRYSANGLPIYKILDRSTWEIGGKAVGNEIWMRCGTVDAIIPISSVEQCASTEWYLPSIQQPNIFQFLPLQTGMQGFTMAFSKDGALVTWPTTVSHTRTLIEKPSGEDCIVHWHEHCNDLSAEFETPVVEVLFAKEVETNAMRRYNLYEEVRYAVSATLHEQAKIIKEPVEAYGVMEEWGLPNMDSYIANGLPKLYKAGIKRIMLPSEFENNMNVWGVSNMCCTVDLKVAETVGKDKFTKLCQDARGMGMKIEMWGNTSLSTLTDIFSRSNPGGDRIKFLQYEGSAMDMITQKGDPWIRNLFGGIEADHYTPVFACMNLRNQAVRDYWMSSWSKLHHEVGVDGIFVDSSFNLSSDKFHFIQNAHGHAGGATIDQTDLLGHTRPMAEAKQAVETQYHAYLSLLSEMQALGYGLCVEDLGVFGVCRTGPDVKRRYKSLPVWVDSICDFDRRKIRQMGEDPFDVYFKGLAYRMMWYHYWVPYLDRLTFKNNEHAGDDDNVEDRQTDLLKIYTKVLKFMDVRHIDPKGNWVQYRKNGTDCYWVFNDSTIELASTATVTNMADGKETKTVLLHAQKNHVYLVRTK